MKPKPPLEHPVERAVVALYASVGCWVGVFSRTKRRGGTRLPLGFPDILLMHPAVGVFYHETKREKGKLRASQQGFIRAAESCGVRVVVGGVTEAKDHLRALGLIATVGSTVATRPLAAPTAGQSPKQVPEG